MTTHGRLALAAVASLVLHLMVIAGNWMPLPQQADGMKPLQARLTPLPPAVEPVVSKPAPTSRRAAPRPAAAPVPGIATAGPQTLPEPQLEAAPAETPAAPAAPEPPQQLALAAESSAVVARSLPRRGRITYSVSYGETRSYVGKVVQEWQAADGSYRISSDAETGGIVELFRPQRLRYVSQGRITREGLRPESFLMSRTRRGQNEVAQARFDWNASNLAYGYAREPKSAPLPTGAQDFMSFIYQFVVAPPAPGRHRVPITTGSRFEVYEIEVMSEESIETPLGTLKALPVKQLPRPGAESIEIWLAADYRYLPVRIRHFDREGNYSGEQVASEIRVSEE